jgi:hypothetical protein
MFVRMEGEVDDLIKAIRKGLTEDQKLKSRTQKKEL